MEEVNEEFDQYKEEKVQKEEEEEEPPMGEKELEVHQRLLTPPEQSEATT